MNTNTYFRHQQRGFADVIKSFKERSPAQACWSSPKASTDWDASGQSRRPPSTRNVFDSASSPNWSSTASPSIAATLAIRPHLRGFLTFKYHVSGVLIFVSLAVSILPFIPSLRCPKTVNARLPGSQLVVLGLINRLINGTATAKEQRNGTR